MPYTPQTWHDSPATDTPITAARLGVIETAIQTAQAAVEATPISLTVSPSTAAARALTVRGLASQTGNLQEWRDSANAVLARVTPTGAIATAAVATASRPTAATAGAGAMIYDTTLSKPIWSDGSTWRDAAGTAV